MKRKGHIIKEVLDGSIAQELELVPGDTILEINGEPMEDVFDYQYLINDEYIEVLVRTLDGEELILEIEKDYTEDLGIVFDSSLMDDYKSCSNQCIFCFIDQLPKGMRDTMYFKDDDSRLSFLQGNYITLTNMKDQDLERIIRYKLEPINISVHTTNPSLRCRMLNNRFAGKIISQLDALFEAGIIMNAQIVLCKGINDGEELNRTIADLSKYIPNIESVSVVPVGLSDHREGLYPLEPFTKEDATGIISLVEDWQKRLYGQYRTHFIHASDEWYLLADLPIPEEDRYDGYLQLENGVGMLRLLEEEFNAALEETKHKKAPSSTKVTMATGVLAAPVIRKLTNEFMKHHPEVKIDVREIYNDFFGRRITVSGLLTGQDIIGQLKGQDLGDRLLLPVNVLRAETTDLLDDVTVADIESALQIPVTIVKSNGQDLVYTLLGH